MEYAITEKKENLVLVAVTQNVRNVSAAPYLPGQFEINL